MTINPHIMQALGRERTADLLWEATADRTGAQVRRASAARQPATRTQLRPTAPQELVTAGAQKR